MKIVLFVLLVLFMSCEMPIGKGTSPGTVTTPQAPSQPASPELPIYTPPFHEGMKEINTLRAPRGMTLARSLGQNVIAQDDPLYGACDEPGSIYMFYDDGALVQYKPEDGTYTLYSLAFKGDVEAHNALYPNSKWDIKTVSLPGFVFDLSHDPEPTTLRIRFLNNDGTDHLFSGIEVNLVAHDPAEYASWVYPDGTPKPITRQTFGLWGAEDGHSVIHMQLGGDGVSIPPYTFHF